MACTCVPVMHSLGPALLTVVHPVFLMLSVAAAEGLETQYGGNPAAPEKHLSRLLGYASSSQALGQLQNTCRTALQLTGQLETATAVHACLQGILHQRVDSILGELSSAGAAQAVQVCLEQRYPAQAIAAGSLRIPKPKDFQEAAQDLALLQSEVRLLQKQLLGPIFSYMPHTVYGACQLSMPTIVTAESAASGILQQQLQLLSMVQSSTST